MHKSLYIYIYTAPSKLLRSSCHIAPLQLANKYNELYVYKMAVLLFVSNTRSFRQMLKFARIKVKYEIVDRIGIYMTR